MEFSRPEYWSGQPFPSPGDLPNPGIENQGLLHCRQILYQLSYQGSPLKKITYMKILNLVPIVVVVQSLSCVRLFSIPWTIACQAPLSMGFPGMNTAMGCHFLLQGSSQQIIPDKFITDSNIKTKYILFSFIKIDI